MPQNKAWLVQVLVILVATGCSRWEDERAIWHQADDLLVFEDWRSNGFDFSIHLGVKNLKDGDELLLMIFSKPYYYEVEVQENGTVKIIYCKSEGYNSYFTNGNKNETLTLLNVLQSNLSQKVDFIFESSRRICHARDGHMGRISQTSGVIKRR